MGNPWSNSEIGGAFEPMHTEVVTVICKRDNGLALRQPLSVVVFLDSSADDPLGEVAIDTDRQDILIGCRKCDWAFVHDLRRGDTVVWDGRRFAVQSVADDAVMGYVIKARSI